MISKKQGSLFYAICFLGGANFMLPVWYFFFTLHAGLGLASAIFLSVFIGFAQAMFELPSGAWSDRFGRKKILILGQLLHVCAIGSLLLPTSFIALLGSCFLIGVGVSLQSGNIDSILHDTFSHNKKNFEKMLSRKYILMFAGRSSAALAGALFFIISPYLTIITWLVSQIIRAISIHFLDHSEQKLSQAKNNFAHIGSTFSHLKKDTKSLYILVFSGVILLALGHVYWFTFQPFLQQQNFSIAAIGVVYFFISAFSALGSHIASKLPLSNKAFSILAGLFLAQLIVSIAFIFFKDWSAFIPIMGMSFIFGFMNPLTLSYLLDNCGSDNKSTLVSMYNLSSSLGLFIVSGLCGILAQNFGLEKVYFYMIIIILFIMVLDHLFIRRKLKLQLGNS